jgi:hypothetical protein
VADPPSGSLLPLLRATQLVVESEVSLPVVLPSMLLGSCSTAMLSQSTNLSVAGMSSRSLMSSGRLPVVLEVEEVVE